MGDPEGVGVEQIDIDRDTILNIGRIVRGCAEVEDLVQLYICSLTGLSATKAVPLFGRQSISTLKGAALYLAKIEGGDRLKAHKATFTEDFNRLFKCRNVIAHGAYLGRSAGGNYLFMTAETADPEGGAAVKIVQGYSPETLSAIADVADKSPQFVTGNLGLEALRQTQRAQLLAELQEGRPVKQSSKRRSPPRP